MRLSLSRRDKSFISGMVPISKYIIQNLLHQVVVHGDSEQSSIATIMMQGKSSNPGFVKRGGTGSGDMKMISANTSMHTVTMTGLITKVLTSLNSSLTMLKNGTFDCKNIMVVGLCTLTRKGTPKRLIIQKTRQELIRVMA